MKKPLLIITLLLMTFACALADDAQGSIGVIKTITGRVLIYDGVSPRGADAAQGANIMPGNIVVTNRDSSAVVAMNSGDRIALAQNTSITFTNTDRYDPKHGKTVYKISKRGAANGVKIGLKTAVIGVKGTEFLINTADDDSTSFYLKEGTVSVDAINGEFTKHNAVVVDEYEAYIKKMTGEYDQYMADLNKEFTEYVASFTMTEGQAVSINGSDVNDITFDSSLDQDFDMLNDE